MRFCHGTHSLLFRGSAGVSRGGQQQFATQTLRVHLLGLDSMALWDLNLDIDFGAARLQNEICTKDFFQTKFLSRKIQKNPRAHKNKIGTSPPKKNPNTPPPKTRNFMDMAFPAERTHFFQASIKLAQPFPAPELQANKFTDTRNSHEKCSEIFEPLFVGLKKSRKIPAKCPTKLPCNISKNSPTSFCRRAGRNGLDSLCNKQNSGDTNPEIMI